MVNRNLLRQYDLPTAELQQQLAEAFDRDSENWLPPEAQAFEVNKLVKGKVLNVVGDEVWIDVGYKSQGVISLQEWYDEGFDKIVPPHSGEEIQVLLDAARARSIRTL